MAALVSLLFAVPNLDWHEPLDHFESFSGGMAVTRAEWEAGRSAMPFGVELDPENMNLLTDKGFCNALYYVARLKAGAGKLAAPVCSTCVFMMLSLMVAYVQS